MMEQISIFDLLGPQTESRFTSEVKKGSGFTNGKIRIYCASLNMNGKELARFLSDEYGVGGHSADFPDGGRGFTDYNSKGLMIREWKSDVTERYSWLQVAQEVKKLISRNEYLTAKEWAKVREVCGSGPAPVPMARMAI